MNKPLHLIILFLVNAFNGSCAAKGMPPRINNISTDLETVDGRDISLTCKASGVPQPKVIWNHQGKILLTGRHRTLSNGNLHISNVQFEDSGKYICYAENKYGNTSRSFNFIVRKQTEITNNLERLEVRASTDVAFQCKVTHDKNLELRVFWLHDGKLVDHGKDSRFIQTSDHSLIITKTTAMDSGIFTCFAETNLDETVASGSLIVLDVPTAQGSSNKGNAA